MRKKNKFTVEISAWRKRVMFDRSKPESQVLSLMGFAKEMEIKKTMDEIADKIARGCGVRLEK
jgi:hypothetical protein